MEGRYSAAAVSSSRKLANAVWRRQIASSVGVGRGAGTVRIPMQNGEPDPSARALPCAGPIAAFWPILPRTSMVPARRKPATSGNWNETMCSSTGRKRAARRACAAR